MTSEDRLRAELEALEHSAPGDLPPRPSLDRRSGWRRTWAPAALAVATGVLVGVVAFEGLGSLRSGESPEPSARIRDPRDGELISIPTAPPRLPDENGMVICNQALLSGVLVSHAEWGLTVGQGVGDPPLVFWPNGYLGRIAGDRMELLDDKGRVVARTGDRIKAAGGGTTINGVEGFGVCPGTIEVQAAEPAAGFTQEQAVAAARAAAPQSADRRIISAKAGPLGELLAPGTYDFSSAIPSDRWVWVINLGSGQPLGEGQGSIVVIDFLDGRVYGVIDWIS